MAFVRVRMIRRELFASTVMRMAAINGVTPDDLLRLRLGSFRNVAQVRDAGLGIAGYSSYFPQERLAQSILINGTLATYYLGERAKTLGDRLWPIPRSMLREGASLRACPSCTKDDFALHGIGIWRLHHQLPLTVVCTEHAEPLIEFKGDEALVLPSPTRFPRGQIAGRANASTLTIAEAENDVFDVRMKGEVDYATLAYRVREAILAANSQWSPVDWVVEATGKLVAFAGSASAIFASVGTSTFLGFWTQALLSGTIEDIDPSYCAVALAMVRSEGLSQRRQKDSLH